MTQGRPGVVRRFSLSRNRKSHGRWTMSQVRKSPGLEGNGANPCSEGGLHAGTDRLEAPEVGGRSARVTQKGPR